MKKISMFILIFSIFILSGCSITSNRISENEIFEKNKECNMLQDQIIKDIETIYWKIVNGYTENGIFQVENPQIFYNPKYNSCLYYSEVIQGFHTGWISARYILEIINFFNKETIEKVICDLKANDTTTYSDYPIPTPEDMQNYNICVQPFRDKLRELR